MHYIRSTILLYTVCNINKSDFKEIIWIHFWYPYNAIYFSFWKNAYILLSRIKNSYESLQDLAEILKIESKFCMHVSSIKMIGKISDTKTKWSSSWKSTYSIKKTLYSIYCLKGILVNAHMAGEKSVQNIFCTWCILCKNFFFGRNFFSFADILFLYQTCLLKNWLFSQKKQL